MIPKLELASEDASIAGTALPPTVGSRWQSLET
jgi:hypothetical protein